MIHPRRIEGYVIVSEDGMLANAARKMPPELMFEADQHFFEKGLDAADVVVHGRHSQEQQPRSPFRRRLILTRAVPAIAPDPANANARLWNPSGASFEEALAALGLGNPVVAVIGGPEAFGLFLTRFDVFYLSRAPGVRLPGGIPVFPGVPASTPEQVLARNGLTPDPPEILDAASGLSVVAWRRRS